MVRGAPSGATAAATQITADTPFGPDDDQFHRSPDDNPYWAETTWWSFNIPERKIGGWLHGQFNTNRGTVTWRVYVWDPSGAEQSDLRYFRMATDVPVTDPAPDLRDITIPGGGFSVKMIRPLRDYEIEFEDSAADFAIRLAFAGVHDPRRFTPGEPPLHGAHAPGPTRPCHRRTGAGRRAHPGGLLFRPRSLMGPARRPPPAGEQARRSGGTDSAARPPPRRGAVAREIERARGRGRIQYIFGHSGPDTGFLRFVRVAGADAAGWAPLNHGWLLQDGRFELLDKSASRMKNYRDPLTGWSSHMQVDLVDVRGRTLGAEGIAASHICERGGGSTALMRWDLGSEIGWGEDQDIWHPKHFALMRDALQAVR